MNGELNMFFMTCFTIGWIVLVVLLFRWIKNVPTTCTGNCNQGRNCTCIEKKPND
jgi:hypothetical protein